jgi:hypothetical protein
VSDVLEKNDATQTANGLLPLLKEYTNRLRSIREESQTLEEAIAHGKGVNAKKELDNLRFEFYRLVPAANDLARQGSQLVEHAKLDTVTKVELSLRVAEFEGALNRTRSRLLDNAVAK